MLSTTFISFLYCYLVPNSLCFDPIQSNLIESGASTFLVLRLRRILRSGATVDSMAVAIDDQGSVGGGSTTDLPPETPYIKLATYNIQSGRGGRLEMALREMELMNIDIGFLTETKLTDGIYTRFACGYHVRATEAVSHSKGGTALFWRDRPNWMVKSERCHGPNVMSCELRTGGRRHLLLKDSQ